MATSADSCCSGGDCFWPMHHANNIFFMLCRDGLLGLLDLNRMRNCVFSQLMLLAAVMRALLQSFLLDADAKFRVSFQSTSCINVESYEVCLIYW